MSDFVENAAHRPTVDSGIVLVRPEEYFRGTVPKGDDLVCVLLQRIRVCPGQPEVCQLDGQSVPVYQNVLRLQITMHNAVAMAILQCQQQLVYCAPDLLVSKGIQLQVLFQVAVHILEDQLELVLPRHDLFKRHYVGVF